MRSNEVVGLRIVEVRQSAPIKTHVGARRHIEAIVLDNGKEITFDVAETDDDVVIEATVQRRQR